MFCNKCGKELKDDAKFCNKCGNKIKSKLQNGNTNVMEPVLPVQPTTTNVQTINEELPVKKEKSNSGKGVIIGLVIGIVILTLAVILLIVYLFFGDFNTSKETTKVEVKTEQKDSNKNQSTSSNDYKISDSNSRYLSESELQKMSTYDLYIARNEIFARHGRDFKKDDLKKYFATKSWYHIQYTPEYFDANSSTLLNDYERKNSEKMLSIEKARNSPYLVT